MMEPPFPPFDPEDEEQQQQTRLRDIPLRTLFPNILTLLAICSGLTAIRFAIENRIEMALAAILLAAVLDGIDGRVARFLKSTTRFGAQMDSLADFVNFGVAPAMLLYFTVLENVTPFGWIAALIYAMCACLRLARFNVQLEEADKPEFHKDFFVGVPAPAAAMIVLLPVYLMLLGMGEHVASWTITAIYTMIVGLLMVSNLRTYSGKTLGERVPSTIALPMILAAVVLVAIVLSYPWYTLAGLSVAYLLSLPWSAHLFQKLEREHIQTARTSKSRAKKPKKTKPQTKKSD